MLDMKETWSQLSPQTSQIVICDLQEQLVARSNTTVPEAPAKSAEVLCQIGQLFGLPLTLSVVPEANQAPRLIFQLKCFATEYNQFLRATASPFVDQKTQNHIAAMDRPMLIIAGFARLSYCTPPWMRYGRLTESLLRSMPVVGCRSGPNRLRWHRSGTAAAS
jgi:hypothetical protein